MRSVQDSGTWQSLGQLTYSFLQVGGGTFGLPLSSNGTLAGAPGNRGVLELTGQMWVAGDPSSISISSVPEPASLGLLALGGLVVRRRRTAVSS